MVTGKRQGEVREREKVGEGHGRFERRYSRYAPAEPSPWRPRWMPVRPGAIPAPWRLRSRAARRGAAPRAAGAPPAREKKVGEGERREEKGGGEKVLEGCGSFSHLEAGAFVVALCELRLESAGGATRGEKV